MHDGAAFGMKWLCCAGQFLTKYTTGFLGEVDGIAAVAARLGRCEWRLQGQLFHALAHNNNNHNTNRHINTRNDQQGKGVTEKQQQWHGRGVASAGRPDRGVRLVPSWSLQIDEHCSVRQLFRAYRAQTCPQAASAGHLATARPPMLSRFGMCWYCTERSPCRQDLAGCAAWAVVSAMNWTGV